MHELHCVYTSNFKLQTDKMEEKKDKSFVNLEENVTKYIHEIAHCFR